MAAARRSSESTALILMVVFLVAAFAAIGSTVAFYQQSSRSRDSIQTNQAAFDSSVGAAFRDNGWQLTEQTPQELGWKYGPDSYKEVAQKLQEASTYEKELIPLLGWAGVDGAKDALQSSPAQKEAADQGQAALSTLKDLLDFYQTSYVQQSSTIADLRKQVSSMTTERDQLQANLAQREKELGQQINDEKKAYSDALAKQKKDYDDVVASFDAQQKKTAETQDKLQQETNAHKADVSKLQDQVAALQEEVRKLTVPGEGKKLTADGTVISVDSQYDVVFVDGGKDKNYKPEDTFVVYGIAPDGKDRYKGTIKITQVFDTTSRASIAVEKEFILQGDYFVSTKQWDQFHPPQTAAAAGGS